MKAIGKWILCQNKKQEKSQSGRLFLPADAPTTHFEVLSIGADVTIDVKVGDTILFHTRKAVQHEDLVFVHEEDVFSASSKT